MRSRQSNQLDRFTFVLTQVYISIRMGEAISHCLKLSCFPLGELFAWERVESCAIIFTCRNKAVAVVVVVVVVIIIVIYWVFSGCTVCICKVGSSKQ